MYDYIIGNITSIKTNYIVLENNLIGYKIFVGNPFSFKEEKNVKIYIYQHITEDENSLYGFLNEDEKDIFLKLISVKGLGCKMAIGIIAGASVDGIKDAIERENILYLKKFPKIGEKIAKQIVLDLKGKLGKIDSSYNNEIENNDELKDVLINLGYKEKEIKNILGKIDNSLSLEDKIKQALGLLLK